MDYTLNFGAAFRGFDDLLAGLLLGLEMGLAGLLSRLGHRYLAALAAVYGGRPARILVGVCRPDWSVLILSSRSSPSSHYRGIGIRLSNVVTFAAVLAVYVGVDLTESFRAATPCHPARHY